MKRLCICGIGRVGYPMVQVFRSVGVEVIAYDIMATVAETTNPAYAVSKSDACIFIVPTPSRKDGSFSNNILINAITEIANEVETQKKSNYLFIIASTVTPGSCTRQLLPLVKSKVSLPISFAYKPEFIALGQVEKDLRDPTFLLIGSDDGCGKEVEKIYRQITGNQVVAKHMNLIEAELAKIALNCAITMKISFANQIAMVAERFGANPFTILDLVGSDNRIGNQCLHPGLPFGGPCFPRDNKMFQYVAKSVSQLYNLSEATDIINQTVRYQLLLKVAQLGQTIGILGLAYKVGVNITDESTGTYLRDMLRHWGKVVYTHDVMADHEHSLEQVLSCPVIVIACPWKEYSMIDFANKIVINPWGFYGGVVQEASFKTRTVSRI